MEPKTQSKETVEARLARLEAIIARTARIGKKALETEEFRNSIRNAIDSVFTTDESYIQMFFSNEEIATEVCRITGFESNPSLKKNIGMILHELGAEAKLAKMNNKMLRGYLLAKKI